MAGTEKASTVHELCKVLGVSKELNTASQNSSPSSHPPGREECLKLGASIAYNKKMAACHHLAVHGQYFLNYDQNHQAQLGSYSQG